MTNCAGTAKEKREPDFNNLLKVLARKVPDRPTLFEFFLNQRLHRKLTEGEVVPEHLMHIAAYRNAGYDYATILAAPGLFPHPRQTQAASCSMNEAPAFADRAAELKYRWMEVEEVYDFGYMKEAAACMAPGMKLIVYGPDGMLENMIRLIGFDNLCYALADDPEWMELVAEKIGSRLLRYYEIASSDPAVGACIVNDDWGFHSQPMLSPAAMRHYIIPWHRKMVEAIHRNGKPAILHSCGRLESLMEDIIEVCRFDAKHSWEDNILPVEEAYERYHSRIAILGGIDVDFICRRTEREIQERVVAMLERTRTRGGYALGTGNSVPEYVPDDHYFAMINALLNPDGVPEAD